MIEYKLNYFQSTSDQFIRNSKVTPEGIKKMVSDARAEHLKWHSSDGHSLFVFGAWVPMHSTLALLPISTVNFDSAISIAQTALNSRGYSGDCHWCLLFQYPVVEVD